MSLRPTEETEKLISGKRHRFSNQNWGVSSQSVPFRAPVLLPRRCHESREQRGKQRTNVNPRRAPS